MEISCCLFLFGWQLHVSCVCVCVCVYLYIIRDVLLLLDVGMEINLDCFEK